MADVLNWLQQWITPERIMSLVRALAILAIGIVLARLVARSIGKMMGRYAGEQHVTLFRKISFYVLLALVLASSLRELGFNLSVLLGAAGVLSVALGFASQTSASNMISGLFILADPPFKVGDLVKIGGTMGLVHSIELLSVKLRTFQNALIRIPNETVIKSDVENLTHWPIRRIDIDVGVAYKEDIGKVRDILMEVADSNPYSLEEPEPLFVFKGYGNSSIDILFCIWCQKENYLIAMNKIKQDIKEEFDRRGVEIPFPHLSLYTGSVTDPFPVTMVGPEKAAEPASA